MDYKERDKYENPKNNVKKYRLLRQMPQNQLAKTVDISAAMLSYVESGKKYPTVPSAVRIARALNTNVESLWGEWI